MLFLPASFVKDLFFPHWMVLLPLLIINWPKICKFSSGPSVLFHWLISLSPYTNTTWFWSLKILISSENSKNFLLCVCGCVCACVCIVFPIWGPWNSIRIWGSAFLFLQERLFKIIIGVVLNLKIKYCHLNNIRFSDPWTWESYHLLRSSLVSFRNALQSQSPSLELIWLNVFSIPPPSQAFGHTVFSAWNILALFMTDFLG